MKTATKEKKVTIKEFADKHNKRLTRRGKKMSWGYLYRLIRQDMAGEGTRELWFNYEMEGDKDRIWIIL